MVKVQNVYAEVICPDPAKPLRVVTKPTPPEAIQDQAGVWWVGFTPEHYKHMAINAESSIRFIKDQK
ncbi:MAG: hypothetical protein GY814_12445, partial [Gammaproteobacteria bacterium]|nr:hypothetical protein [Gammaproteobacteria bacterium]